MYEVLEKFQFSYSSLRFLPAWLYQAKAKCVIIATLQTKEAEIQMPTTTVSIGAEYLALLRQYSELSGIPLKAATEYAIDRILVSEIEDYCMAADAPEPERLISAANAILPGGWKFNVGAFGFRRTETLIGLNLSLNGLLPTYVTQREAQAVRDSLHDLPNAGGSFRFGGEQLGDPVFVRRQGQGILLQVCNRTSGIPDGAKTTIAATSAYRIAMALDLAIEAAKKHHEELV